MVPTVTEASEIVANDVYLFTIAELTHQVSHLQPG
jgi:hypothetical protein